MKLCRRLVALLLVVALCAGFAVTAFAASNNGNGKGSDGKNPNANENASTNNGKGKGSGNDKKDQEKHGGSDEMILVEDETTVLPGTALRATTYALPSAQADAATNIKYFGSTMYDYDATAFNNATHQAEVDYALTHGGINTLAEWNGIYFGTGDPGSGLSKYDYNPSYTQVTQNPTWSTLTNTNVTQKETTYYYLSGSQHYKVYVSRSGRNPYTYTLEYYDGKSYTSIATGTSANSRPQCDLLYTVTYGSSVSKYYAPWNFWTGHVGSKYHNTGRFPNATGNSIYSGLVKADLDKNGNIQFVNPDAGIFTNAAVNGKDIYYNVRVPFVYDEDTRKYTFDSNENGAYFKDGATPGDQTAENTLYFDEGHPQGWSGMNYGDGSQNMWAPFNQTNPTGEAGVNYHFGMQMTVPFSMTADGQLEVKGNTKEDITFHFSGDDDVWVFIDGHLVLDLGGIHNRLNGDINFAQNTATLYWDNSLNKAVQNFGDVANLLTTGNGWTMKQETKTWSDKTTKSLTVSATHALLNKDNVAGLIGTDLATFAATENHTLTVFYLERGAGTSNCRIEFNLPQKDYVTVTKHVAGVAQVDKTTGKVTTETGLDGLSPEQQAVVNNQNFGFTLYKKDKDSNAFAPVANAFYSLLASDNSFIRMLRTDGNGHFTLKNGQSARFIGEFDNEPNQTQYYVVEDTPNGYIHTEFSITAKTAYTQFTGDFNAIDYWTKQDEYYFTDMNKVLQSKTATVTGSGEARDELTFVCSNYVNASLPDPTALPADDEVVVDFGLDVEIDLTWNDYYVAAGIQEITFPDNAQNNGVYEAEFGTFTYDAVSHKIIYHLTKQLTDVETIPYELTVATAGITNSATATVRIIPASIMYYEENFAGLVETTKGTWQQTSGGTHTMQETSYVGEHKGSPYGADIAYLNDNRDSNGSALYTNTASGSSSFQYRFTGTGTSFFARTSADSATLGIKIYDGEGALIYNMIRDTKFVDNTGANVELPLYNIPVFTIDNLPFGDYTVDVAVQKGNAVLNRGNVLYLDGIRVFDPMGVAAAGSATLTGNRGIAQSAYEQDGEAFMKNATVREKLIQDYDQSSWDSSNFIVFTDSNGKITSASEYVSDGPKEEVYLYSGQSVTFALNEWSEYCKVFLGMKAPTGSATLTINGRTVTLNNAMDYYFDISDYYSLSEEGKVNTIKITAGEGQLVSLTNIKVTGSANFTIINTPATPDFDDSDLGPDINIDGDEGEGGEEGYPVDLVEDITADVPEDEEAEA